MKVEVGSVGSQKWNSKEKDGREKKGWKIIEMGRV
jgi:hypothetical protein